MNNVGGIITIVITTTINNEKGIFLNGIFVPNFKVFLSHVGVNSPHKTIQIINQSGNFSEGKPYFK